MQKTILLNTTNDVVPTLEEMEQLFSKLPEGKYVWFRYGGNLEKWALWFAPNLMTGKAKIGEVEGGWHHIATMRKPHRGFEFWGSECGNFAFKLRADFNDEPEPVTDLMRDAVMNSFKRLIEQGTEQGFMKFMWPQ